MPRKRIPGVWPISVQKLTKTRARRRAGRATISRRRPPAEIPSPLSSPKIVGMIDESRPEAIERKPPAGRCRSRRPRRRVTRPAWLVSASWSPRRISAWASRSATSSSASVSSAHLPADVGDQAESLRAIAARTSGASATRSTSICALSLARISSQIRSATSLSIARRIASSSCSWSIERSIAACRRPSSMIRSIAWTTASLSTVRTIVSSTTPAIARSSPVAPARRAGDRAARTRPRGCRRSALPSPDGHLLAHPSSAADIPVSERRPQRRLADASRLSGQTLSSVSSVVCQYAPGDPPGP